MFASLASISQSFGRRQMAPKREKTLLAGGKKRFRKYQNWTRDCITLNLETNFMAKSQAP